MTIHNDRAVMSPQAVVCPTALPVKHFRPAPSPQPHTLAARMACMGGLMRADHALLRAPVYSWTLKAGLARGPQPHLQPLLVLRLCRSRLSAGSASKQLLHLPGHSHASARPTDQAARIAETCTGCPPLKPLVSPSST